MTGQRHMTMTPNFNDGSASRPRMRMDLSMGTLGDLPAHSRGPRGAMEEVLGAIRAAGYEGIQAGPELADAARRAGLAITGSGRVDSPDDADALACQMIDAGIEAATLHVGTGFESDADADRMIDAILETSARRRFPLFVETHRATLTQDCWRTLQLIERHPDLRLNGDFSHWYTGQELVYGNFDWKLAQLRPVFERVRFFHGRIGNPGCMQMVIDDLAHPAIEHFGRLWRAGCAGFLRTACPGDVICFTPELLSPRIYYAQTLNGAEQGDRWLDALALCRIAKVCFEQADSDVFQG